MLPGLRFLFAAIVLSMSVLIFGLGAAALLRATHEEFASITSRRPPPEIMFTQQSEPQPTLALLRVEPLAEQEKAGKPASDGVQTAAPMEQPATAANTPEPEKPAAEPEKIETASPSEALKPEPVAPEMPVQAEASVQIDAPAAAAETKVAAIAESAVAPSQTAVTAPEQVSAPIDESTRIAETKIATLGGPPVTIETQTPAKAAPAVVRKSAHTKRVVKRPRIAQRARVAQPAPQVAADPFAQPLGAGQRTR
jgi:hypothetical protein